MAGDTGLPMAYIATGFTQDSERFYQDEVMALRRLKLPIIPFSLRMEQASAARLLRAPVGDAMVLPTPFAALHRAASRHAMALPGRTQLSRFLSDFPAATLKLGVMLAYFADLDEVGNLVAGNAALPMEVVFIAARLTGRKFAVLLRPGELERMRAGRRQVLEEAEVVFCASSSAREKLVSYGILPRDKIHIHPPAILFSSVDIEPKPVPQPLILAHAHSFEKAHSLQKMVALVQESIPRCNCLITAWQGEMPEATGGNIRRLRDLNDWQALASRAHALVLTTNSLTDRRVLSLHQMLISCVLGIPTFCESDPIFADLIDQCRAITVVPENNPAILAHALQTLICDDSSHRRQILELKSAFEKYFDLTHTIKPVAEKLAAM